MLANRADGEFARDRDDRGEHSQWKGVCAQQQAKRESGNPSAPRIKVCKLPRARANELGQECEGKNGDRVSRRDLKIKPKQAIGEQRSQYRNLVMPGILR